MARRIIEQLAAIAYDRPHSVAIKTVAPSCYAQRQLTYSELHRQVSAAADGLRLNAGAGDVIMLFAPNQPEFVTAFLAALLADLTIFPIHPGLTMHEIGEAVQRTGARTIIASADKFGLLQPLGLRIIDITQITSHVPASREMNECTASGGLMLQTSGTTGAPKIVYRSAESLDAVARNVAEAVELTHRDRVLAAMPLCHSYGVENGLLAPILAGASIHLSDGFDPASIAVHFAGEGITVFSGVPFMYQILAERNADFVMPMLRLAYSAGGMLPSDIADRFRAHFGVRIGQLYGSTEMGSVTFGDPHHDHFRATSVGKAMRDVRIRILDPDQPSAEAPLRNGSEGLVAVSAPSMLDHYVGDPSPALVDGFFHSGDLGRIDDHGNLIITGRLKLQIDVGGMKVNPLEVEHVLAQHPAVRECVVVPERVTHTVNRLKALILLRQQRNEVGAEELRQFVRERLASYKVPRLFEFRESLPKSPTGKILREALVCD
jgi:long-chain acyl-CoA synthetase